MLKIKFIEIQCIKGDNSSYFFAISVYFRVLKGIIQPQKTDNLNVH